MLKTLAIILLAAALPVAAHAEWEILDVGSAAVTATASTVAPQPGAVTTETAGRN